MGSTKFAYSVEGRIPYGTGVPLYIGGNMSRQQAVAVDVCEPVEETVHRRYVRRQTKPKRQPPYHVVLWNDDAHTFSYVIGMLGELFGHPAERGFQMAEEVHHRGRVICLTTTQEHAELKRDQIHSYGLDDLVFGCRGSMSASIESKTD